MNFPRSAAAVEKMGKVLKVSSSGYYYWRKHPVGVRQMKHNQLLTHVRQIHTQGQDRYGTGLAFQSLDRRRVAGSGREDFA